MPCEAGTTRLPKRARESGPHEACPSRCVRCLATRAPWPIVCDRVGWVVAGESSVSQASCAEPNQLLPASPSLSALWGARVRRVRWMRVTRMNCRPPLPVWWRIYSRLSRAASRAPTPYVSRTGEGGKGIWLPCTAPSSGSPTPHGLVCVCAPAQATVRKLQDVRKKLSVFETRVQQGLVSDQFVDRLAELVALIRAGHVEAARPLYQTLASEAAIDEVSGAALWWWWWWWWYVCDSV